MKKYFPLVIVFFLAVLNLAYAAPMYNDSNCSRWKGDSLPKAIGQACGTSLPEVRLIQLENGSLLTSLKERKVVTVWDPVPQRSPYGTPFFHEDNKEYNKSKRSIEDEYPEKGSNDLRAFEKWYAEQSSHGKGSLGQENDYKGSLRPPDKTSNDNDLKQSPSDESHVKKRSSHKSSPGGSTSKKVTQDKSLFDEGSSAKRSIHKRDAEPLFQLCLEYPGNVYVLVDDDDNLVFKVKTLKCSSDGCFIASNRFRIGECIATKKTIVLHISNGCNGLKPLSVEVGCNCRCLKNLQFL